MVAVATDGVRLPLARARVIAAAAAVLRAERVREAMVSITFVSRRRIRALNKRHLGRDRETDVIAFAFQRANAREAVIGDVYIAPEVARDAARGNGIPVREELVRLVVHGTLHVLDYDHPEGAGRTTSPMWKRQERIVARLMRP